MGLVAAPRLLPAALIGAGVVLVALATLPDVRIGGSDPAPVRRAPALSEEPSLPGGDLPDADEREAALRASTTFSLAMHMHGSLSEGDAGMVWHTNQALTNNIDVLWWSDHDVFFYPEGSPSVDGWDFESGALYTWLDSWPSTENIYVGWTEVEEDAPPATSDFRVSPLYARSGSYGGRISATANADGVGERATWFVDVSPKFQFKSLMSVVNLSFWVRPITPSSDGELRVVVPLSGTRSGGDYPNDDDHKSIVFYHGSTAYPALSDDGLTIFVPITAPTGAWTEVSANLTDLATAAWGEQTALDLHGEMITARVVVGSGASVAYDLDDLAWTMDITGQDLVTEQAAFLATLGSDPIQLQGIEVSPLEQGHFNVFGSAVPLLPYATSDSWDAAALADWVHGYGGLVAYNHMFGVSMQRDSAEEREANVQDRIDTLIASGVWDADLLEIGYRVRNGLMSDFLEVWDALGMAGIYKTGIGAFDLHDELDYASFTNNLVTYLSLRTFSEGLAITELKRGNVWFGDPTYFPSGHVTMSVSSADLRGVRQGAVVVGRTTPISLTFSTTWAPSGTRLRRVENGVVTATTNIATGRRLTQTATIDPVGGNVVRWEIVSTTGNPVAYTNPVYFVDTDPGDIPTDRYLNAATRPPR